jgi:hypothetical protein
MSIDLIHNFFFASSPYVIIVIIIIMYISHKRQSIDTKNIKSSILELNNEINRIRNESEWRSEIQSQGKF